MLSALAALAALSTAWLGNGAEGDPAGSAAVAASGLSSSMHVARRHSAAPTEIHLREPYTSPA
jgi:hypothetical protein